MHVFEKVNQISFESYAKRLFDNLDTQLLPKVSIVCISWDESLENSAVISSVSSLKGMDVEVLKDVRKIANELEKVDRDSNYRYSNQNFNNAHISSIKTRAIGDAICMIFKKEIDNDEIDFFISEASFNRGYLIYTLLELNKGIIEKYYSLKKNTYLDWFKKSRSYIESTIKYFLIECTQAFNDNKGRGINRREGELMINAAKEFMYSIVMAIDNHDVIIDLYEVCNSISSLKYEGADGIGKMVIAKRHHMNISLILELKDPISIHDFRKVRKFLELCNDDTLIVSDSQMIYGLGKMNSNYNATQESLFVIDFKSHYKWEVLHDNKVMLRVEYQIPILPKEKIDREDFYNLIPRVLKDISEGQINSLWEICLVSSEQKHGTMLVISDQADSESKRLRNQCFTIGPRKLETSLMKQITSIDGAVLLNRDSICYAIGVILDGIANDKGDSSRGARYNSAIRYYDYVAVQIPTVIVIISEDGMIDLIPRLSPKINHQDIVEAIDKLSNIGFLSSSKRFEYNKLMNYFLENSFYLTEDECNTINSLSEQLDGESTDDGITRIEFGKFYSNPEMNDSYYL
ncbi:diadenylate cyclase [Siphonobacter sp. SORGH_AS_1065]|uniref:DNA integrity scanning protein DisA nucleotide-binding domain protein n=1 Tax=Siphonobacter sp. SORGH_AS_1065 TaxID=3041795 RepID=UPI00278B09E3|nr:diadenylate cyclase [Siphonobacter sp. SORGH_AS_1065]MDQ1085646.1 hypothetical protein [Siphonobacter sp. SORGH_AS_1065]